MPELDQVTREFITWADAGVTPTVSEPVRDFVEKLTFAAPEEILSVLQDVLREDPLAIPVWARNLAYRLACLQRPDDPTLLRDAAYDLLRFGPDWDTHARAMLARAEQLES
ncbi:hypothetical protein [Kitasatospora sp. NPDC093806]|uniref:hypothetical protein n=1 Tax=Kitasatospora sp. NPDC093806 TaxID=3155075 RepID=UPI003443FB34